jgi:hypothetical protein
VGQFELGFVYLRKCPWIGSMDKTKRGNMLRSRFKALGGVMSHNLGPSRSKRPQRQPKACNRWTAFIDVGTPAPKWIRIQNEALPSGLLRLSRKTEETALTRMSRKLCLKLPKIQT